jgi:hypothetical protein
MFNTIILNNVVSQDYADKIEDLMFSIPWHFHNNLTFSNFNKNCNVEYGFIHRFYDKKQLSDQFNFIEPLLFSICEQSEIKNFSLVRSYAFLQTKLEKCNKINDIHVNSLEDHIVICYYVHEIDGETVIYDQTINDTNIMHLNQEERKKLPLNRGAEILLRSREENKKEELKIVNFKLNRILFRYEINFEFFITKQERPLGEFKC